MEEELKLLAIIDNSILSNYVKLPPSVLEKIKDEQGPYYFRLESATGLKTWVGVMDFTSDESFIVIPQWIMEYFGVNSFIFVKYEPYIPKGKFVKFQPQEEDFYSVPECESFLQAVLSNFCLIHLDQTIQLDIMDVKYHLKVLEIGIDWEKVDFEKATTVLSNEVIDIKNVDLEVDIDNKFYKEVDDSSSTCSSNIEDVEVSPGTILNPDAPKLNEEEIKQQRLEYFMNIMKGKKN